MPVLSWEAVRALCEQPSLLVGRDLEVRHRTVANRGPIEGVDLIVERTCLNIRFWLKWQREARFGERTPPAEFIWPPDNSSRFHGAMCHYEKSSLPEEKDDGKVVFYSGTDTLFIIHKPGDNLTL